MTGELPPHYGGRLLVHEVIDGIDHHWVWSPGDIHRSRAHRMGNYTAFAVMAALRSATLPRPRVVFVSSPPLTVAPLGPMLAYRFGCPWLLEVRDIWPESAVSVGWLRPEGRVYGLLEGFAHRVTAAADAVVVPTPGLEPLVRAHGARRIVTLPGTAFPRPRDEARRAATRAALGIGDEECVFLYLGAIGVANGLEVLIEAVRRLPAHIRARVLIAGDGSARATVADALRAPGLSRVELLPPAPIGEVDDLLAAADVGLHLLRPDPVFESALPSKVLDYLGAQLPFITSVPGLPAKLAAESGGSSVRSAQQFAVEIERWAALAPEERRRCGEQAFVYGQRRFGLESGVRRLESLLFEMSAATA